MSNSYVDWKRATSIGSRVSGSGPTISATEADEAVAELRDAAHRAYQPVAETAQLDTTGKPDSPVRVVDRAGWIRTNVASFEQLTEPVIEKITAKRRSGPLARRVGGIVTGTELGSVLGWASSRVLGQYDLGAGGTPSLLLVAPNVVAAERELQVDPSDFRLWVCLHEETHRVQFTAVEWLREHMIERTQALLVDLVPDADQLQKRLTELIKAVPQVVGEGSEGLGSLFITPEQREELAALTAVMSLLEGHADVVMDDVGPRVVPSVEVIRTRFDARRRGRGSVDRLLRRLLGMEAKMRQYRDGARFVRAVQEKVGVDGFNAVWASPQTLPTAREIEDPATWIERVHG